MALKQILEGEIRVVNDVYKPLREEFERQLSDSQKKSEYTFRLYRSEVQTYLRTMQETCPE